MYKSALTRVISFILFTSCVFFAPPAHIVKGVVQDGLYNNKIELPNPAPIVLAPLGVEVAKKMNLNYLLAQSTTNYRHASRVTM